MFAKNWLVRLPIGRAARVIGEIEQIVAILAARAVAVAGEDLPDQIHHPAIRHHAGDFPGEDAMVDGRENSASGRT